MQWSSLLVFRMHVAGLALLGRLTILRSISTRLLARAYSPSFKWAKLIWYKQSGLHRANTQDTQHTHTEHVAVHPSHPSHQQAHPATCRIRFRAAR